MIAFDCASVRSSSNSTVGTWPALFIFRNSGVRVSPLRVSISIHRYDSLSLSQTHFTFRQLPEFLSPWIFIAAAPVAGDRASVGKKSVNRGPEGRGQNL